VARDTARIDGFYSSLYSGLRRLAHQRLRRKETITLLNTTALVHELWSATCHGDVGTNTPTAPTARLQGN
jgi:hypothetical protein